MRKQTNKDYVLKKYPNAKLKHSPAGYIKIITGTYNILSEYLFYDINDEEDAWRLAKFTIDIKQNLDRTHPLRLNNTEE